VFETSKRARHVTNTTFTACLPILSGVRDWTRALRGCASTTCANTYASHLIIDVGLDVVQVSRPLGHTSHATTLRVYAHVRL
jgi:integrase